MDPKTIFMLLEAYNKLSPADQSSLMDLLGLGKPKAKATQDLTGDGKVDSKDDAVAAAQAKERAANEKKQSRRELGAKVQNVAGFGTDLIGRLIQGGGLAGQVLLGAGGVAAGALGNAALKTPATMVSALQSPRQREMYGSGIFGAAGNAASTIGDGVGVALPALGAGAGSAVEALTGATGSWVSDIGNALKLAAADDFINSKLRQSADSVRSATAGMTSPQIEAVGRTISANAAAQRGNP